MQSYSNTILPRLVRSAMRDRRFENMRRRVIPLARGRVLEVGIGSGENLPFYGQNVSELFGLDPSEPLMEFARDQPADIQPALTTGVAEEIPFASDSFDTVVMTWTLCSVSNTAMALSEIRRVLRADGTLLFIEHGLAPHFAVRAAQNALTPLRRCIGGNCHMNRPIADLIGTQFRVANLRCEYLRSLLPLSYMYEGQASPN